MLREGQSRLCSWPWLCARRLIWLYEKDSDDMKWASRMVTCYDVYDCNSQRSEFHLQTECQKCEYWGVETYPHASGQHSKGSFRHRILLVSGWRRHGSRDTNHGLPRSRGSFCDGSDVQNAPLGRNQERKHGLSQGKVTKDVDIEHPPYLNQVRIRNRCLVPCGRLSAGATSPLVVSECSYP